MEIVKLEMIEEFEIDNKNTTGPDDETMVLNLATLENGVKKYLVQYELGGVAGHAQDEYFETEKEAREYIKDNI